MCIRDRYKATFLLDSWSDGTQTATLTPMDGGPAVTTDSVLYSGVMCCLLYTSDLAQTSSVGVKTAWTNMGTAMVRGTTTMITALDKEMCIRDRF